jgi:cytochrome c biogenesis protein CcdA
MKTADAYSMVEKGNKSKTILIAALAGCGLALLIAAHGFLIVWGESKFTNKNGDWFLWIAGGALMAFGLYHVIQKICGKGRDHSNLFGRHAQDRGEVECGPHEGFLVNLGHGFIEITIFGSDVPPRFRLFFYNQ